MTMRDADQPKDTVFRFEIDEQPDVETDALKRASRKLIEASEDLRRRSDELRDEMMRKLSV